MQYEKLNINLSNPSNKCTSYRNSIRRSVCSVTECTLRTQDTSEVRTQDISALVPCVRKTLWHQTTYDTQDIVYIGSANVCFTEHNILTQLENLKFTKCPGPDTLHPQILYEVRYKIVQPLKILFENKLCIKWACYPQTGGWQILLKFIQRVTKKNYLITDLGPNFQKILGQT